MIKTLIATFSQAGSTKKIAHKIALGLSASNWEVTHINITGSTIPDLDEYDVIGIGTPTYFFRPPFIVEDFVQGMKGLEGKPSFVFILHGTHPGNCGNWIRRKLKSKGSRDLGYFRSFGADYWMGYIKRGIMFCPNSPTDRELSSAVAFGKKVTVRFSEYKPSVEPFDEPTPLMYGIERMLVDRPVAKLMYSKTFQADTRCDNCGICISKCPVNNISEEKNKKLKWHSDCILCATCELSCPKDAIHSAFDWKIFAPFMHYNISTSKNKNIPYATVKHENGKTQLI